MIKVSTNQALQRWDTLPDNLREALASETNPTILWKICEDEHLAEEKIRTVARIAGYVMLGFLHPEEVAREIQEQAGIGQQIASSIAKSLNNRVFDRMKDEIDRVYAPPGKEEFFFPSKIAEEAARPAPLQPVGELKDIFAAVRPKPAAEASAAPSTPPSPKAPEHPFGGGPAPFILHAEEETKPIEGTAGFRFEPPPQKFGASGSRADIPQRPARIEIGGIPELPSAPKTPTPPPPQPELPKVVNYTPLKTSLEKPVAPSPPPNLPMVPQSAPSPQPPWMSKPPARPVAPPPPLPPKPASAPEPFRVPQPPPSPVMGVPQEVKISAGSVNINVIKPPEAPKPASFSGRAVTLDLSEKTTPSKKRGFFGWLISLFKRKSKIVDIPHSAEINIAVPPLKETSAPAPPAAPRRPFSPYDEVIDLSTLQKIKKNDQAPAPPPPQTPVGNTVNLKKP